MRSSDLDALMRDLAGAPPRDDLVAMVNQEPAAPLAADTALGPYTLVRLCGEGGFAEVWEAIDPDGARVALKTLHARGARKSGAGERFEREWRTLARLVHPNIVRLLDVGTSKEIGRRYLTMELVEGVPLGERELPLRELLTLFDQLFDALAFAHSLGVVHRDLKPANVMVCGASSEHLRVLDFGIAGHDDSVATMMESDHWKTGRNAAVGTVAYMSPEQALGDHTRIGPTADLYSAGVMLFEALGGRPAFSFESKGPHNWADAAKRHIERDAPALEISPSLRSPWDDVLIQLVRALLARRPEDRPESAADVRRALRPILDALPRRDPASAPQTASPTGHVSLEVALRNEVEPVGRASEKDRLLRWARSDRNHPEVMLLEGEVGVGKSSLARWLKRTLYRSAEARNVRIDLADGLQSGLASVFPATRHDHESPFSAIAKLVETPVTRMLVLRLDECEAHRIPETVAWAHNLLYHPLTEALPLRIIWALDSGELWPGGRKPSFLRMLAHDPRVHTMELGALDDAAMLDLCRALDTSLGQDDAEALVEACQGNVGALHLRLRER